MSAGSYQFLKFIIRSINRTGPHKEDDKLIIILFYFYFNNKNNVPF